MMLPQLIQVTKKAHGVEYHGLFFIEFLTKFIEYRCLE